MDQEESLELYRKGSSTWNAWANEMIAERKALEESGDWKPSRLLRNKQTSVWFEKAKADFKGYEFQSFVDFRGFRFPGDASFHGVVLKEVGNFASAEFLNGAFFCQAEFGDQCIFSPVTFSGETCFKNTTFRRDVYFRSSKFSGDYDADFENVQFIGLAHFGRVNFEAYASFNRAKFSGLTRFDDVVFTAGVSFINATFTGRTLFNKTEFPDPVYFNHCVFEDDVFFSHSTFASDAVFSGVRGKAVVLDHPKFSILPDFTGAHFEEAPVLDAVDLDPECINKNEREKRLRSRVGLPERWRTLRKIAVQGHDHERELLYFKGEVTARRGTRDTWRNLWFWVGWTFQVLSDFGRSATRPLVGLGISVIVFAIFYTLPNDSIWEQPFSESVPCKIGSGDARVASILLSLHNTVPVAGIASTGKIQHAYACLYGIEPNTFITQEKFTNVNTTYVPYGVVILGFCQSIISTVFIFLVLLAIRNRFRIR